jgi:hypothetical protein
MPCPAASPQCRPAARRHAPPTAAAGHSLAGAHPVPQPPSPHISPIVSHRGSHCPVASMGLAHAQHRTLCIAPGTIAAVTPPLDVQPNIVYTPRLHQASTVRTRLIRSVRPHQDPARPTRTTDPAAMPRMRPVSWCKVGKQLTVHCPTRCADFKSTTPTHDVAASNLPHPTTTARGP